MKNLIVAIQFEWLQEMHFLFGSLKVLRMHLFKNLFKETANRCHSRDV